MNYMRQIADMLGIKVGEKFKIKDQSGAVGNTMYMLTTETLITASNGRIRRDLLERLLNGKCEIAKPMFKPKEGQWVYIIDTTGIVSRVCFYRAIVSNLVSEYYGLVFETREEAEANAEKGKAFWDRMRMELEER